jgi:hypothetical protein
MNTAHISITGGNYTITSEPLLVSNLDAEVGRLSKFIIDHGGSCRNRQSDYSQSHEWCGYYHQLNLESELFFEGILITLAGRTHKDARYYVNPLRNSLADDLRSPEGVCLADFAEYNEYARLSSLGQREQRPAPSDPGMLTLTLEGAVRYLDQRTPRFHGVTGMPKTWPIPLKLLR